jgi:hypothetical protein
MIVKKKHIDAHYRKGPNIIKFGELMSLKRKLILHANSLNLLIKPCVHQDKSISYHPGMYVLL